MAKKVIRLILHAPPILKIFFAFITVAIACIQFFPTSPFFIFLTILLGSCLIAGIPEQIDHLLSRFGKYIAWWIVLGAAIIGYFALVAVAGVIPDESTAATYIKLIFTTLSPSIILYLTRPFIKLICIPIRKIPWKIVKRLVAYIDRLLTPSYLFPIKLITYPIFYLLYILTKTIVELVKILIDINKYPFKSFRNFLKSLLFLGLAIYIFASVFVIIDYLRSHYGYYGKFLCSYGVKDKLKKSVVRVVGGYSEGTGFFVSYNQVLTNFHVVDGEPSPKIIFPDGKFVTAARIIGNKDADLALLFTDTTYPDMVMPLTSSYKLVDEEPLIATGYAMGTKLVGDPTILRGNFISVRSSRANSVSYIQTNISLVGGMSGGPLTDQCGEVVGINTQGISGLSLFISGDKAKELIPKFTDQEIEKIDVDPSKSPTAAVRAFYIYLKARRMEQGFKLLSQEYLQKTNFYEWTSRFTDILDVEIFKTEQYEKSKDTVFVKFGTKNWVNGEVETHLYEGTWKTILEEGVYKMLKSNIKEVTSPDYNWFYE